jgi:hypothetical protein
VLHIHLDIPAHRDNRSTDMGTDTADTADSRDKASSRDKADMERIHTLDKGLGWESGQTVSYVSGV